MLSVIMLHLQFGTVSLMYHFNSSSAMRVEQCKRSTTTLGTITLFYHYHYHYYSLVAEHHEGTADETDTQFIYLHLITLSILY